MLEKVSDQGHVNKPRNRSSYKVVNRNLAGRCFQIVSALCQPPGAWIPSLLSRLVETAGLKTAGLKKVILEILETMIHKPT
ncbi:unnamed protein product, partial [Mesorhabditis belari]|uniref:Uncharacterized protein n=1 Tax=Mesorhabditis belari TaxID=2138241 RepID=A0AAF3J718_9BILA